MFKLSKWTKIYKNKSYIRSLKVNKMPFKLSLLKIRCTGYLKYSVYAFPQYSYLLMSRKKHTKNNSKETNKINN